LALGELCWHLAGSDDLSFITYYAPRWREFSDDDSTIVGSCYGKRVFGKIHGAEYSQWEKLLQLLRHDLDSRRAVLHFHETPSNALRPESRDVACALSLQFLVRDGKVHAVTTMRSNDIIWGLPYDVFLFTMLQELLACDLGLDLGIYYHHANSLHLYSHHDKLSKYIIDESDFVHEMPAMVPYTQLYDFLGAEENIRLGRETVGVKLERYWQELASVLSLYRSLRSSTVSLDLKGSPYEKVLLPLFGVIS
jgi:thymidylate synthase